VKEERWGAWETPREGGEKKTPRKEGKLGADKVGKGVRERGEESEEQGTAKDVKYKTTEKEGTQANTQ